MKKKSLRMGAILGKNLKKSPCNDLNYSHFHNYLNTKLLPDYFISTHQIMPFILPKNNFHPLAPQRNKRGFWTAASTKV
jgi:hypothetical protein